MSNIMRLHTMVTIFLTTLFLPPIAALPHNYCTPNDACWPTKTELAEFTSHLQGQLVYPGDDLYNELNVMVSEITIRYPALIALVENIEDIRHTMLFARRNNIKLLIRCSGHNYNGRSTANDSLLINLSRFNHMSVNLTDERSHTGSSIWVEGGVTWGHVYDELDKYNKQAAGGDCPRVCVAGTTLGGGEGVLMRGYGLAVDNLIQVDILLYNGTIARCNFNGTTYFDMDGGMVYSRDTDLFWAVRGGGGGTYGVVVSFLLATYEAPLGMVAYTADYLIIMNDAESAEILLFMFNFMVNLNEKWGSTVLFNKYIENGEVTTDIVLVLVYNGQWDDEVTKTLKIIDGYKPDVRINTTQSNYTTYLKYMEDLIYVNQDKRALMVGTSLKLNKSASKLAELLSGEDVLTMTPNTRWRCGVALIGGKISQAPHNMSAISHNYRESDFTSECTLLWDDNFNFHSAIETAKRVDEKMLQLGEATYMNKALVMAGSWRKRFYGENYERLLEIKRKADPYNIFTCNECVGYDEVE